MSFKWICIGVLAILAVAAGVGAEEEGEAGDETTIMEEMRDYYGDEEFVTIATGSKKPVFKAPAVATVITAEEIKQIGARDLDEVLETVAGIHVVPSTQGRLDSVYSIRGIHTRYNPQVLFLINGLSFPHFTGGRPFHFRLPVTAISRVEVIRGPGSAVYGADAYAGVINIITKDAIDINGTEVGGRIGSFDTHDLWLQRGVKWKKWNLSFCLEWQESDGDRQRRINSDIQSSLDQTFGTDASNAPGPLDTRYEVIDTHIDVNNGNWRLRHWYWRQNDAGLGAGSSLALDPKGGEDLEQHLSDLSYNRTVSENWEIKTNFSYLYRHSDSRFVLLPPGTTVPIGKDGNLDFSDESSLVAFPAGILGKPSVTDQTYGADVGTTFQGFAKHRLRLGTGIKKHKVRVTQEEKNFGPGVIDGSDPEVQEHPVDVSDTPFSFLPDASRTSWYVSIQDEWQLHPNLELTYGIRYDNFSDFGGTLNPRLALVWAVRHNLTAKLMYGRAFRAPSISELYSKNNPVGLGNIDLNPETIDTYEVAFDYRPTFDLLTKINFFIYRAKDLVEFVPDTSVSTFTAQNARDQTGYGLELETKWILSDHLTLNGHYAWQRSEDSDSNTRVADVPSHKIYLSSNWNFMPDWSIFSQLTWIGGRKRPEGDFRKSIDDYSVFDLTLRRHKIFEKWDLALAVRNVFNSTNYEPSNLAVPSDYPLEGRHFWGEIKYRF